jgi:transposase-like protein
MSKKKRRTFTPEYKAEIVAEALLEGNSANSVAKSYGIGVTSILSSQTNHNYVIV